MTMTFEAALTPSPRAFGYVRVSTTRQDLSVEAQTESLQRAAVYHTGHNAEDIFNDPDTSGSTPFIERAGAQRLIAELRQCLAEGQQPHRHRHQGGPPWPRHRGCQPDRHPL